MRSIAALGLTDESRDELILLAKAGQVQIVGVDGSLILVGPTGNIAILQAPDPEVFVPVDAVVAPWTGIASVTLQAPIPGVGFVLAVTIKMKLVATCAVPGARVLTLSVDYGGVTFVLGTVNVDFTAVGTQEVEITTGFEISRSAETVYSRAVIDGMAIVSPTLSQQALPPSAPAVIVPTIVGGAVAVTFDTSWDAAGVDISGTYAFSVQGIFITA
jgi:hypothetical protein